MNAGIFNPVQSAGLLLLPLQGGGWEGDGEAWWQIKPTTCPIPTLALPLKGRECFSTLEATRLRSSPFKG